MNQKGFINIVLVVLVVALAGIAGYFALIRKPASVVNPKVLVNQTPSSTISTTEPTPIINKKVPANQLTDWKIYRMDEYGFEIKYPADMEVQELGPFGVGYFSFVFKTAYIKRIPLV